MLISLSQAVPGESCSTPADKAGNLSRLVLLPHFPDDRLHILQTFSFRRKPRKNLRVLCLRYAKIKIAVKLLRSRIRMRMIHAGIRRIINPVSCLQCPAGVYHVLVENGLLGKTAEPLPEVLPIQRTYIGAEICLDTQCFRICLRFPARLIRIIECPRNPFLAGSIRIRQLSGIADRRFLIRLQRF